MSEHVEAQQKFFSVRNHAETVLPDEMELAVPGTGIQRPSVRKRHDRTIASVFLIDCRTIFHRNSAHAYLHLEFCGTEMLAVFDLVRWNHYGSAFVFNQEHYEFRWFGLAGVSPDDVNIRGTFVEGLTRCQRHFFSAPHLHTIEPSRT